MKKHPCSRWSKLWYKAGLGLALSLPLAFSTLAPHSAEAQTFVKTYREVRDVKQYSVIAVEDADRYLMAGTYMNRFIHFMRTDGAGNILDSKWYDCLTEQRTIRIIALDANRYLIVSLRRDASGATNARDRIRLLEIDEKGSILSDQLLESSLPAGTNNYVNMYPLNALCDQANGILYICGYVTKQPSTYPNYPQLASPDDKKGFVLRIDLSTLGSTCNTFDYTFTGVPPGGPQPTADYDMAMAMRLVSNGTNTSLYVTGSCNFVTAATGTPSLAYFRNGTMNLQLNPTSLAVLNTQKSFADPGYAAEYGMDIVRNTGAGGGFFIVGNTNSMYSAPGEGILAKTGFVVCTYINNTFTPVVSPSITRLWLKDVRAATALQTLPGNNGGNNILIAGMQMGATGGCEATTTPDPSIDNFNPFLQDFTPSWSGTAIGYTSDYWHTYLTRFGTGSSSLANSYMQFGKGLSLYSWSPFLAYRRAAGNPLGDDNIVLTGPSWNPDYDKLNTKLIRTEAAGKIPTCEDGYMTCHPGYGTSAVKNSGFVFGTTNIVPQTTVAAYGLNVVAHNEQMLLEEPYEVWDCELQHLYRQTPKGGSTATALSAAVHPNPANNYVQVRISGTLGTEDHIDILLTDITGKMSVSLYNGAAGSYSNDAHLQLPQLAAGMYFVSISVSGKMLPVQKLIIQ